MSVSREMLFTASLLVTIVIETGVLFAVIRLLFKIARTETPTSLLVFTGILASSATLPYLWFVLPHWIHSYWVLALVGEPAVWLAESVFYRFTLKIGFGRAMLVSFLCNGASYAAGLWLFK